MKLFSLYQFSILFSNNEGETELREKALNQPKSAVLDKSGTYLNLDLFGCYLGQPNRSEEKFASIE